MPKYKQGPMMLNYIAQDHEIVRGRPYEIDLALDNSVESAATWYIRTPANERFGIPANQISTEDGTRFHIGLTKHDTLSLPSDGAVWICVDGTDVDSFTMVSLAGLELRYWELADAMPDWKQPEFKAFSYALHMAIYRIIAYQDHAFIWAWIDGLEEAVLDEMAVELRAPYYDETLPIETKREIVRKALLWHEKAGTRAAVESLISVAYGRGEIEEWSDFGGDPYTFRFNTPESNQDPDFFRHFSELIRKIKNVRSHLCEIRFIREEKKLEVYVGVGVAQDDQATLSDSGLPNPESVIVHNLHVGIGMAQEAHAVISGEGLPDPENTIIHDLHVGMGIALESQTILSDAGIPNLEHEIESGLFAGAATCMITESKISDTSTAIGAA